MIEILKKAKETHNLSKAEIIQLLTIDDATMIFESADEVRKKYVGDEVHLRALIEFSNICRCNCLYCGIRCENKSANRYRLTKEQIVSSAKSAIDLGYKTIVLQSGEDAFYTAEMLADIIKEIKQNDVAVTLSIGERSFDEYKLLKEAGADRFLLRIETTDEKLYKKMHPNMSFENRKRCLFDLKKLGYETGTGCIVGLPNQTVESLADDILFFKELDADMIGIGPLIVHNQTPLKDTNNGSFDLSLRVMAITRLLLPDINIPATTAMETIIENGRFIALQSGANVIMPNFTEQEFRENYDIYPKDYKTISPKDYLKELAINLNSIGRIISNTKGMRDYRLSE